MGDGHTGSKRWENNKPYPALSPEEAQQKEQLIAALYNKLRKLQHEHDNLARRAHELEQRNEQLANDLRTATHTKEGYRAIVRQQSTFETPAQNDWTEF